MHIADSRVPIAGASDHGVSEAFYLDDPEGNGVEVYADRPPETWTWVDGLVTMPTEPLDIDAMVSVLGDSREPYRDAPGGLRIGHVHLRVGEVAPAERFYREGIGLDLTRTRQARRSCRQANIIITSPPMSGRARCRRARSRSRRA